MAERDDEDLRQKFRRARKAHLRMGARMALIGLGGFGGSSPSTGDALLLEGDASGSLLLEGDASGSLLLEGS